MIKSLNFLHLFFMALWIGGMIYTLLFLRPSLQSLKREEDRADLLRRLYGRFFAGVWLAVAVLFISGMGLWHGYRKDLSTNPLFHFKLFLFALMVLVFSYIYFFLFRKGRYSTIPNLVWINLALGTLIILIITYIS